MNRRELKDVLNEKSGSGEHNSYAQVTSTKMPKIAIKEVSVEPKSSNNIVAVYPEKDSDGKPKQTFELTKRKVF